MRVKWSRNLKNIYFMNVLHARNTQRWQSTNDGNLYFRFEQFQIIPLTPLLLTFIKNTALGVLSFSIHHFCSICNQSELTQVRIITFEKKNKKWALVEKPLKRNKQFDLKICSAFGKILYCIRKYFIIWDVQPQEKNDVESGCLWLAAETKSYSIFGTNNCSKIITIQY